MRKILIFALALALPLGAMAAEQQIEVVVAPSGSVSGENAAGVELNAEDTEAATVRYLNRAGEHISWGFGLERMELADMDGGAYNLQALLRVEGGNPFLSIHATGGFGLMLTDVVAVEQTISTGETVISFQQSEQESSGAWHLEAGVRGAFTNTDQMGWLLAYQAGGALGEGFLVDESKGLIFALTIPTGAAPTEAP